MSSDQTLTADETFDAFVNGRLPKDAWTHEAHLITAWVALRDRSAEQTLAFLRHAIQTHNCGIGISNTETSGYHETLTRYYVTAVVEAIADGVDGLDQLFAHDFCSRTAPLLYWSRDRLFSVEARLGWSVPDLQPTPWRVVGEPTNVGT